MALAVASRIRPHRLQHLKNILTTRVLTQSALLHNAKASSDRKPIILEQPDAFRPPSHPARLRRRKPRMVYGREITEEDREDMDSKSYPFTMPGRNTFTYKLMHARYFHAFFTISILTSLALFMWILDFHKNNRYRDIVPHSSLFFRHPISYLSQYYQIWRLNQADSDREHREKRDQRAQDVEGRRRYREAHDLPEVTGLTQWLGMGTKEEEERLARKRTAQEELEQRKQHTQDGQERVTQAASSLQEAVQAPATEDFEDGDAQRPKRKVFLGIWGW